MGAPPDTPFRIFPLRGQRTEGESKCGAECLLNHMHNRTTPCRLKKRGIVKDSEDERLLEVTPMKLRISR